MKTTVITPDRAHTHQADLMAYHGLRYEIFVSLQGLARKDLYAAADLETDIWDLPVFRPVHFLVRDGDEALAVARVTNSMFPTMMETHYAGFVDGPCPKAPDLWEVQRLGVKLTASPGRREEALLTLMHDMHVWYAANDVRRVMLLTFDGIFRKRLNVMKPMGPVGEHLGFPHRALMLELEPEFTAALAEERDAVRARNAQQEEVAS